MAKFKIKLIDIGREKINQEYDLEAENLDEAANLTYVKAKRFLMSSETSLDPDEDDEESWTLYAGFRAVGKVKIMEVKNAKTNN